MNGTLEQHSGKDAKLRRAAGVIIFSFALLILAIVSWHMVSPATAHEISYDDAIKQIANGNVKSARFRRLEIRCGSHIGVAEFWRYCEINDPELIGCRSHQQAQQRRSFHRDRGELLARIVFSFGSVVSYSWTLVRG